MFNNHVLLRLKYLISFENSTNKILFFEIILFLFNLDENSYGDLGSTGLTTK